MPECQALVHEAAPDRCAGGKKQAGLSFRGTEAGPCCHLLATAPPVHLTPGSAHTAVNPCLQLQSSPESRFCHSDDSLHFQLDSVRKLAKPGHPFDWHRGWQRCGTLELHTAAALWVTRGDGVLGLEAAAVLVSDRSPGLTLGNVRGNSA